MFLPEVRDEEHEMFYKGVNEALRWRHTSFVTCSS